MASNPGLPRYHVPLSPFEIGLIFNWCNVLTINMEQDAVLRKLGSAVDAPLEDWTSNWQQAMSEAEALQRLHASLNPVVIEFTLPELRTMLAWSDPAYHGQIGAGGNFRLAEEEFLIEKLQRHADRATEEWQARRQDSN